MKENFEVNDTTQLMFVQEEWTLKVDNLVQSAVFPLVKNF